MSCKKVLGVNLADLYKRCPANQAKQFIEFRDKTAEYKRRVNKYPEFLPKIDWSYYRANVRPDYVKLVDEFEKKYEEFNKVYDGRHELDNSKYYTELEKLRETVKQDVAKFIVESNKRIKRYRDEIERINSMIAYNQMTMEDYIDTHPHPLRQANGEPTFWPHTPDEQPSTTEAATAETAEQGVTEATTTTKATPTIKGTATVATKDTNVKNESNTKTTKEPKK